MWGRLPFPFLFCSHLLDASLDWKVWTLLFLLRPPFAISWPSITTNIARTALISIFNLTPNVPQHCCSLTIFQQTCMFFNLFVQSSCRWTSFFELEHTFFTFESLLHTRSFSPIFSSAFIPGRVEFSTGTSSIRGNGSNRLLTKVFSLLTITVLFFSRPNYARQRRQCASARFSAMFLLFVSTVCLFSI